MSAPPEPPQNSETHGAATREKEKRKPELYLQHRNGADEPLRALEAIRFVASDYGLKTGDLKPCVAFVLDGNIGGASLWKIPFVLGLELRRMGLSQDAATAVLKQWARKVDERERQVIRSGLAAYAKNNHGAFRYHPPGLLKKPGTHAHEVLSGTCEAVGCPNHCPPLQHVLGRGSQTFRLFESHGWPAELRKSRQRAAIDVYRALCDTEKDLGVKSGQPLFVTWAQLGKRAECHPGTAGRALSVLLDAGLLAEYQKGSGSGPRARDRVACRVARAVPIPVVRPLLPSSRNKKQVA